MAAAMAPWHDKVVILTGSSSGIGQGTAIHFASLGCRVVVTGRNPDRLHQTADLCIKAGAKPEHILTVRGDVAKDETVKTIVDGTIDRFGRIDVLVNNAGVAVWDDIEHTSLEHFDTTFNTNVRGPFHLTMLVVPHLVKTKGCVVNVSSIAGMRPELLTYSMSKAALDHFTRMLAVQLGPKGVRVNSVNLGEIRTPMAMTTGMSDEQYEEFMEQASRLTPLGRYGNLDDVVKAIAFLASDDSSFITGINMPVDGGWQCVHPYTTFMT